MNVDEKLLYSCVSEAFKACETLEAATVFVRKKIERIQEARIGDLQKRKKDFMTIDRHRVEHFALDLPFEILMDLVDQIRYEIEENPDLSSQYIFKT